MDFEHNNSTKVIRQFIWYKLLSNFKAEASRNYLGLLWWLLEPAMMLGIFYLVFGILLNYGEEHFASYLLIGVTGWMLIANTILHSSSSIQSAVGLIQQVYIPKWVFPMVVIFSDYTKFMFVLLMLFAFLLYDGFIPNTSWFALLYWIPLYFFFVAGCSLIVAALTPIFPDLKFIIQALMQMLMFGSGIFYHYSVIPDQYMEWFLLNPAARFIYHLREIILHGVSPQLDDVIYVATLGIITVAIGLTLLKLFDRRYPRFTV